MPTTVHLPPDLLKSVDHRAKELEMSRNRYIIRALERAIDTETDWSARFVDELETAQSDSEGREAVQEMVEAIHARRTRKSPPPL